MDIKLPTFEQATVCVIGDVMLDRYWMGSTSRVSPEAPVPVVHVQQVEERPGGAGNVALNVVALGCKASLLGMAGDDGVADALENQLKQAQIDALLLRMPGVPTVMKLRVLSRHQQLLRMDFEEPFANVNHEDLLSLAEEKIKQAGAVILSDYGKGTLTKITALIDLAVQHDVPVLIDPKTSDFSVYRGATLITPNFKEFQDAAGPCHSEEDIIHKGRALMKAHDIKALLITRSEKGMTLLQGDKSEVHLPAREREVYDVTGAGDTVIAMMAASLAAGETLTQAMKVANLAAGIVVGKLGAATVSTPELAIAASKDHSAIDAGVMNESQLLLAIKEAKARGERIVMTNGCFDILHVGHVTYLKQARALGDRLIIAVNDDASVRRLKGAGRPVNNVDQRMAVLANLDMVDWVVPFSEDTPARVIGEVLPDVLVKGGDYKVEEIAGHQAVLGNGGDVKILSFVDDVSTTALIEKLKQDEE